MTTEQLARLERVTSDVAAMTPQERGILMDVFARVIVDEWVAERMVH